MSAPDCVDCDDLVDNKNAAGHWRDRCEDCQREIADQKRSLRDYAHEKIRGGAP